MSTPPQPVRATATDGDSGSSELSTAADNSLDKILNCTPSDAVFNVCSAKYLAIFVMRLCLKLNLSTLCALAENPITLAYPPIVCPKQQKYCKLPS